MEDILAQHLSDLETVRKEINAITNGLTDAQLNWQPEQGRWSVGQCLEHLIVTGSKLLVPLHAAIERGHRKGIIGAGPFAYGRLGSWFVRSLQPTGTRSVRTQKIYRPASDVRAGEVVPRLLELQDALSDAIIRADGLDLGRLRFPSPAMPLLRLNLAAWLASTIAHEHRHLLQARRVLEQPGFPTK
jgi:hypothetical protein